MKGKQKLLMVVSALGGLFCAVNPAFAQVWTEASAPITNWAFVASSVDGVKLVAVAGAGDIYTSTNGGTTWTANGAPIQEWSTVGSSAEGNALVAVASFSQVFISTNSGVTWATTTNSPYTPYMASVASSADGTRLVATSYDWVHNSGGFYLSTNSGATWTYNGLVALSVAFSADGTKLVAAGTGSYLGPAPIYASIDSGTTWTATSAPVTNWSAVASSSDGTKFVAAASKKGGPFWPAESGPIYISSDSGATWTVTSAPVTNWSSVASSADGTKLVAVAAWGPVYSSADSGVTWTSNSAPSTNWTAVAASADGGKLVAVVRGGGIWGWQSTPAPKLSITARNGSSVLISWIVPSTDFVLQENSADLTSPNWTDVTNAPVLNLTNLRSEVTVPSSNGKRFYRLKH